MRRGVVSTLLLLLPLAAAAVPLTLVRTLGGDEGEVFLHNPASLAYAPDGEAYLLNVGDCQVLRFDADWTELGAFGRCGGGPGEFENAVGLMLEGDEVWVFEMARIVVFGRDGEYRRILKHENTYAEPERLGDRLLVVLGTGDRPVAYLDDAGAAVEPFGPECPADFFEAFKTCRNLQILPHVDGRCLLVNHVDGRATLIGEDGRSLRDRLLVTHEDDSVMKTDEDEEGTTISMSLSFSLGRGCRDAQGRYWFPEASAHEDSPMRVHVLGADLEPLTPAFTLPDGVQGWEFVPAPDGRMVLLSAPESTLYVFEVDPALPAP